MPAPDVIEKLVMLQGGVDDDAPAEPQGLKPKTFATRDYDAEVLADFLAMLFPEMEEGEHVLTQRVRPLMAPTGAPRSEDDLLHFVQTSKQPRALYVSTATVREDDDGKLYNRQAQFYQQHFFILDDIGTKGDESIKDTLPPTYIVETSPNNYQYGYVFKTPITDVDEAKAFVSVIYEAGVADTGGKMPNKYVRLPEGIHGKKGDTCEFVTRLVSCDGPEWTQDEVLTALDTGVTWAEIQADAAEVLKRKTRMTGGTSLWAGAKPKLDTLEGVTDVVLEWLNDENMLRDEGDPWMVIECPWADEHTDATRVTAGYKPLGYGTNGNMRGFHCFHDSCSTRKTPEFLTQIAGMGGPEAPMVDNVAALVDKYVYDCKNDSVWEIKNTPSPCEMAVKNFRNFHPHKARYTDRDGKPCATAEVTLWMNHPMRVTTWGVRFDPVNPARLVQHDNKLYVNLYSPPLWGDGVYDQKHVDIFKDFLRYLMPNDDELEYFTSWLAAKAQNMGFRGVALVMVALAQGVGRTTLTDMMKMLFRPCNVQTHSFDTITGDHRYNEWLEAPVVVANETLNVGEKNHFKSYERLKEMIDPRPLEVLINPKYGKQRRSLTSTSFIFLSNHTNALAMSAHDRRFYVIRNPDVPAPPAYFATLNAWMERRDEKGDPVWAPAVWRWLRSLDVDLDLLNKPPELTQAKRDMIKDSKNGLDVCCEAILEHWPTTLITFKMFTDALEEHYDRLRLDDNAHWKKIARNKLNAAATPFGQEVKIKMSGTTVRPRVLRSADDAARWIKLTKGTTPDERATISTELRTYTADMAQELKTNVTGELDMGEL